MQNSLLNRLPIVVTEVRAVRDSAEKIVDFEWTEVNAPGLAVIGTTREDMVGQRLNDMQAVFRNSVLFDHFKTAVETQKSSENVTKVNYNDSPLNGKSFYLAFAPHGDTCSMVALEATTLQAKLGEVSEHFLLFRDAVKHSAIGTVITIEAGNIEYANSAFLEALGWQPDDVIGNSLMRYIHPDGREHVIRNTQLILAGRAEEVEGDDIPYRTRTGEKILFSSFTTAMEDQATGKKYYITQLQDVGEERRLSKALEDALEQAESASRLKSEFLANMSHEIRTPLNGVLGMAQVLARSNLDADQTEQVNTVIDSGNTLMVLLNDILDLSKIEAGQLDISPVNCDPRHKLSRIHQLFAPLAEEKQIAFQFFVDPSVPALLKMDPVRVRQCLSNLLANAMKFTDEGAVTTLVTAEPREHGNHLVKIFVSDTGIGIPEEQQLNIFGNFQQADSSTTRKYGGTGLGLTVTRSLARMMGGDVVVRSEPGKGSVFILSFTATDAAAQIETPDTETVHTLDASPPSNPYKPDEPDLPAHERGTAETEIATAEPPPVEMTGKTILVVDDNLINRKVICGLLGDHGFDLHEAENGLVALEAMKMTAFDLILLDIHMPVMDGIETLRAMKQSDRLKDMPVIALTANAMSGDREKYIAMGMNGYISKPVSHDEVMTELNRTFDQARTLRKTG